MRMLNKITALILVISMVLTLQGGVFIQLTNDVVKAVESANELVLPYYVESIKKNDKVHTKRLKEDENEYMTIFKNEDESITCYSFLSPVKYRDEKGNLIDYDTRLKEVKNQDKKDAGYAFEIMSSDASIMMPQDVVSNKYITIEKDKYKIDFKPISLKENDNATDDKYKAKKIKDEKQENHIGVEYLSEDSDSISYRYYALNNGTKEEIILNSKPESNIFQFEYKFKNIIPELQEDGRVLLLDEETGEVVGAMDSMFMYDSFTGEHSEEDGHYSESIQLSIEKKNDNKYILTVTVDQGFLDDPDTVYPVIVDPSLELLNDYPQVKDVHTAHLYPTTSYYNTTLNKLGRSATYGKVRTFVQPDIPSTVFNGYEIISAEFKPYNYTTYTSTAHIDIHQITSSWSHSTTYWNKMPTYSSTIIDTKIFNARGRYVFDIKELVENWHKYSNDSSQGYPNLGFIIREKYEDGSKYRAIYTANYGTSSYVEIHYEPLDLQAPNLVSEFQLSAVTPEQTQGLASVEVTWAPTTDLPSLLNTGVDEYNLKLYESTDLVNPIQTGVVQHEDAVNDSYTFTSLDDSKTYECTITATDNSGNTCAATTISNIIVPDYTPPSEPATFTIDSTGWTNNTAPIISWTGITDESAIVDIQYKVDSGAWISTGVGGVSGNATLDLETLADGEHYIYIKALDSEGNSSVGTSSVSYNKDVVKPTVSIDLEVFTARELVGDSGTGSVAIDEVLGNEYEYQVVVGVADELSGINTSEPFEIPEYAKGENPTENDWVEVDVVELLPQSSPFYVFPAKSLDSGFYIIRVIARDLAGNETEQRYHIVKNNDVNLIEPELILSPPFDNDFVFESIPSMTDQVAVAYTGAFSPTEEKLYVDGTKQNGTTLNLLNFEEDSVHVIYMIAEDGETKCSEQMLKAELFDTFDDNSSNSQHMSLTTSNILNNSGTLELDDLVNGGQIVADYNDKLYGYVYTAELNVIDNKAVQGEIEYYISFTTDQVNAVWQSITPGAEIEFETGASPFVKIKAVLSSSDGISVPSIEEWTLTIKSVNHLARTFNANLLAAPTEVSVSSSANYMTHIDWTDSINPAGTKYNVYRYQKDETGQMIEGTLENLASKVEETRWFHYDTNYETEYVYYVTAVRTEDVGGVDTIVRESEKSDLIETTTVAAGEINKMLGMQDYWKYVNFSTGAGNGYINVASGNLVYSATDSVYPSVMLAMVMRRTYNSQSTTKTTLGYGWDFSYNTCLMEEVSGDIILKDGDGSLHEFTKNADGTYTTPNGIFMTLTYDNVIKEYKIVRKDNISYTFNEQLKLIKMSEFDRNSIYFNYDDSGRLETITNGIGATATLSYNAEGLIEKMTDPAGKIYKYEYTDGKLIKASLMQIVNEQEQYYYSESYNYDNGNLALTDHYGNTTTVVLDAEDKVTTVTPAISTEAFSFEYSNDGTNDITTLTDRNGNTTTYTIENNNSGCVKTIKNALDHETHYTYNGYHQVDGVSYQNTIDENLVTISYSINYDDGEGEEGTTGNLLSITDPDNNTTVFTYNKYNQVLSSKTPIDGLRMAEVNYNYADGEGEEPDNGNLLEVETFTDKAAGEKTYTYYDYYTSSDNGGVLDGLIKGVYTSLGEKIEAHTKTEYYYYTDYNSGHGVGWLSEVKQGPADGTLTTVSKVTEYDVYGNPIITEDALGYATKVDYDLLGRPTTTYLPQDGILHDTDWTNNMTTSVAYNLANGEITTTDVAGVSTTVKYDAMYRPYETTQSAGALSVVSSVQYSDYINDNNHKCLLIINTDAMSRVSTQYYDEVGRLKQTSVGTGTNEIFTATYDYDDVGNMTSVIDAENREVKAAYDKLNRQKTTTIVRPNDTDIVTSTFYFDNGQVDYVQNPVETEEVKENYRTSYTYDDIGRIKTVTQNDGTNDLVTSYDYDNLVTYDQKSYIMNTITDANGHVKETYLDAFGRPAVEVNRGETPTNGSVDHIMEVTRLYDANGQMKEVKYKEIKPSALNPNVAETDEQTDYYDYDGWGQIVSIGYGAQVVPNGDTYIDGDWTVYQYYSDGQLQWIKDMREDVKSPNSYIQTISEYEYDAFNRLSEKKANGNLINYVYNNAGQVTTILYGNDEEGAVQDETSYEYSTTYGRLDRVKQNGELIRSYTYTATGQLDYITDYLEFNDPTVASGTGNQLKTDYTYSDIGQVKKIEYIDKGTNVVKESFEYAYNIRGYIEKETINAYGDTNTVIKSYAYDSIGRLETSTVKEYDDINNPELNTEITTWEYDAVGNRDKQYDALTEAEASEVLDYVNNEFNQLTSITGGANSTTYTYNARGGTATEETGLFKTEYYYDAAGNLNKQAYKENNVVYDEYFHWYDGDGQRLKMQKNDAAPTKYAYSGLSLLFTTDGENDRITNNILTPGGEMIASERYVYDTDLKKDVSEGFYFYNTDIRQSTTSIIDDSFTLKKDYVYDAFGVTTEGSQSFHNDVEFTGAVADSSGLHYMNARFYNPNTGRFLTQDTYKGNAWDPMSQHLYAYTGNNPVNMVDPTGHWPEWNKLARGGTMLAIGAIALAVGATIITGGAAAPLAIAACAAMAGGATTALYGLSDVGEAFTGENVIQNVVYGGDEEAYIRDENFVANTTVAITGALVATSAMLNPAVTKSGPLIKSYRDLRYLFGKGSGYEMHHIIEQRLIKHLLPNTDTMLSTPLTKGSHQVFTNLWREAISYGTAYEALTKKELWEAAKYVYKNAPEFLEAARETIMNVR